MAALARPKHLWAIFLFYLAWSGAIELIQPYVNRCGEWMDLAANAAGLLLGLFLVRCVSPNANKAIAVK
ncbi:MAG: hypothetical protein D6794_03275 [Deltaproteobacteria bacterium]|nr:MAG: hypothetical protein D6794_03275 [Deltaproteobacteria bacterium]